MRVNGVEKKKEKGSFFENGVRYSDIFWLFMTGSVIGFVLEGIWHIIRVGEWESHTATVWGPFCIIYGIATALMYIIAAAIKDKGVVFQFAVYAAVGTAIEYLGSLFQETVFGMSSWDYTGQFLNIGGRVSLKMTLIWGVLGIVFAKFIFPLFARILHKMRGRFWRILTATLTVFMSANLAVTAITVWRWGARRDDVPAMSVIGEMVDEIYDDERMKEIFPNWIFED